MWPGSQNSISIFDARGQRYTLLGPLAGDFWPFVPNGQAYLFGWNQNKYQNLEQNNEQTPKLQQTPPSEAVSGSSGLQAGEGNAEGNKKNRNMISNSLKGFRKYVGEASQTKNSPIGKVIARHALDYTAERFEADLESKIGRQLNYLGMKFLKQCLGSDCSFGLVLRTMLAHYYRKEFYCALLTNCRMDSRGKKKQLAAARRILVKSNQ